MWALPRAQGGTNPALVCLWWPPKLSGALVVAHDVRSLKNGSQAALGGSWPMSLAPGIPRETWWLRVSARPQARPELVESGPERPRPGDWVRLLLSGEVTAGRCQPPCSAAPAPGARPPGGRRPRGGGARIPGRDPRGGGAGWGRARGSGPPFLSGSRQVGEGPGRWGHREGAAPRRRRGRAAFKSHWRTGPPEADK